MKIFLDIGAWKGDTAQSVLTSKHHFDKIYCFEPQKELCKDIQALNSNKIEICEFGLWNKTCNTSIYTDANKKVGRDSDGATLYKDKFIDDHVNEKSVKMVKASDWFRDNLKKADYIVMKMNCEGSECDILDDLIDSGEFEKVDALMVDFDVRKIVSQQYREAETVERLKAFHIPIHSVDRYDQWRLRGLNRTHYWMDKIL